jgi:hypothetical protein
MWILILALGIAAWAHRYLHAYALSNAIVARVRLEPPSLRVAAGLLVLSAALSFGAIALGGWVAGGAPSWLNLIVLIAFWDAFKFGFLALAVALRRAFARPRVTAERLRVRAASLKSRTA